MKNNAASRTLCNMQQPDGLGFFSKDAYNNKSSMWCLRPAAGLKAYFAENKLTKA